jgi:hypothetical protein
MANPINIFDDLEDHVDEVLNDLNKMIPKANSELTDLFLELYYQLDKSSTGTIEASVKNLNLINNFRSRIDQTLMDGTYGESVNDYLSSYTSSSKYLNDYFGTIVNTFKANDKLYTSILKSNVDTTANSLLNSGIDANFTDSILKVLKDNVTSGSNKADFIKSISANLNDETGLLSRYVKQVAHDSIYQFNANYTNTISKDLGLTYYFYKGTKISDTRPFCNQLAGKYITEEQLKEFVTQQSQLNKGKGWQGMVKGENWSNFKIYRGGYQCRHYLIPVSKEIYDATSESAKWQG